LEKAGYLALTVMEQARVKMVGVELQKGLKIGGVVVGFIIENWSKK
jgi:hypothetical protein